MYTFSTFHQDNRAQFGKEAEINLKNIGFYIGSIVQTKLKISVQEGVYMANKNNNNHNPVQLKSQVSKLNNNEMEVDTDVNEDPNREKLLDESVDSFLKSKEGQEN
ncbi:hypothetical protein [Peribacillus sp. NPDC097895]|uniref:hypothetical protein n=1 Tax=Peribacillus sp. NPDC097895 TaxID=3390619 RepID=UPI003D001902